MYAYRLAYIQDSRFREGISGEGGLLVESALFRSAMGIGNWENRIQSWWMAMTTMMNDGSKHTRETEGERERQGEEERNHTHLVIYLVNLL
jgi:hypothetical protein